MGLEVLARASRRARDGVFLATFGILTLGQAPSASISERAPPTVAPVIVSGDPLPYRSMTLEQADSLLAAHTIDVRKTTRSTPPRRTTELIIYHGTEHGPQGSCEGDDRTLRGQVYSRGRWRAGHQPKAHLLVCRDGTVKKIQSEHLWVNGAGVSMWNGRTDLSDVAFQVEFETITYRDDLTPIQKELGCAISKVYRERFDLSDSAFVAHAQVAYDEYGGEKVRERKRDGFFDFKEMCVHDRIVADLDAEAGRLKGSPFQARYYELEAKDSLSATERINLVYDFPKMHFGDSIAGFVLDSAVTPFVISAWNYDGVSAKYLLPDGHWVNGKQLQNCWNSPRIRRSECHGAYWGDIPEGTLMFPYVTRSDAPELKSTVNSFIAAARQPGSGYLSAVSR